MQIELAADIHSFHGGKFFEAIGEDFQTLERTGEVISADVLDAWFDPSPRVLRKLEQFLPFLLRTSPPAHASGLVAAIARERGIPPDCILTGGGSSDLIFTCLPRLCGRLNRAMILDPMYGEYRHVLETVMGVELIRFPLHKEDAFEIDTERFIESVRTQRPGLVVIVNPNSPTGRHWPRRDVIRFLDSIPAATQVLIDETYIEYAGRDQSVESEACSRENVVVLKSMSKAYALSGLRVGYLVAAPATVRSLEKWLPPWAVSLPAQVAAVEALGDEAYYQSRYQETHSLREALACDLRQIVTVYPSTTNFLLAEVATSAQRIIDRLSESNIFLRNCDSMGERFKDRFLRIAVKRGPENRRIAEALAG